MSFPLHSSFYYIIISLYLLPLMHVETLLRLLSYQLPFLINTMSISVLLSSNLNIILLLSSLLRIMYLTYIILSPGKTSVTLFLPNSSGLHHTPHQIHITYTMLHMNPIKSITMPTHMSIKVTQADN